MGRVKTSVIKNVATKAYEQCKDQYTDDYAKNKVIVDRILKVQSKRLRNIVVGYVTVLKKRNA